MQILIEAAMQAARRNAVSEMVAREAATRAVPPAERGGYAADSLWLADLNLTLGRSGNNVG